MPAGFFDLRSLLESLKLGLDGGGPLRMLLLSLVQRSLRLVDSLLTAFTVLLPGSLFLRLFNLAPLLLLFEGESGLSFGSLVDGARGKVLCLWAFQLAGFHPFGRTRDQVHHPGGPDPREAVPSKKVRDICIPDLHIDALSVMARNFS